MKNITYFPVSKANLQAALDIYNYYVENSTATFHTKKITIEELVTFLPVEHPKYKSYLISAENKVCGYGYFGQYKKRQAYDRTGEITIYLHPKKTGKGIAKPVLEKLENEAKQAGIKNLIAGITEENKPSFSFFSKNGYQKCAHLHKVGEKFGRMLDVILMEKEL